MIPCFASYSPGADNIGQSFSVAATSLNGVHVCLPSRKLTRDTISITLSNMPVSQVGISCRPRYISWSIPAKFGSSSCLQSSEHLCVCPVQLNLPGTYKRFQCQLKYRNQVEKLCPFQTRPSPEALPKRNFDKSCKNDL